MSELRIIPVTFGGERATVTDYRIKHDWGQVYKFLDIDLPDVFEARFSNAPTGASIPQIGTDNMVEIPAQFFESGAPIYCYITLHDEETDGRTVYTVKTPISPSSDRTDAEPEPEEESIITQAITALNTAVDTTSQKAQEASASADRAEQAAEGVEGYAERAESAQQAAESARDIALEAKVSAQASAATASEKASEAISSATTASQSALTAETASESASASADASYQNAQTAYRYAQDSATSAGQAESYASGASSYASDAQTHSRTASQKALEASQSASTAVQAKTDAESAKTASETAQGLAESARNEAVTAKTDAESARDEAQEIANGITGKVEQIDSNTERIESLEDDRYKPYPTDTASGSIASFPDGADGIPLKSCIVQVEPVQEGSGDPSPDNVRPISGFTGVEVQRTGKNLLDEEYPSIVSQLRYMHIFVGDGTYTLSTSTPLNTANATNLFLLAGNVSSGASTTGNGVYAGHPKTVESIDGYVTMAYRNANGVDPRDYKTQLETGDTATDYEPYQGETYPITFPSEAGTVYGAHIDVINGELVVDRAIVDLGTFTPSVRYVGDVNKTISITLPKTYIGYGAFRGFVCSTYAVKWGVSSVSDLRAPDDKDVGIYRYANITKSETKTVYFVMPKDLALNGQLVFFTAEPQTYPLTQIEIKTLLGQNNLWANTGDTEVEYRADTRLYIEKLTQPEEYDMIADSAINSGQFFMVGNSLYRALANIASGATITVGTNAERVSLSDALNLVNA